MDDLKQDEKWYREIFLIVRNEESRTRNLREWLDEFDVVLMSSRLRHPTLESLAAVILTGVSMAQNTSLRDTYRYGDENE